jgi:predicted nucleic acid-binding protein
MNSLATCAIVDLEMLYSAKSPAEYRSILAKRRTRYSDLPMTPEICARALDVQSRLAKRSQHRGCGTSDLLIAACAELYRVVVLHYDRDFERIAAVTRQTVRWVAPPGSIP